MLFFFFAGYEPRRFTWRARREEERPAGKNYIFVVFQNCVPPSVVYAVNSSFSDTFFFFCFSPNRAPEVQLAAFSIPSIYPASAWPSDHGSVQNPRPQSLNQPAGLHQCLVQLRTIPEPLAKPRSRRLQQHGERQRQQRPQAIHERAERTRQCWSRYRRSPTTRLVPRETRPSSVFLFPFSRTAVTCGRIWWIPRAGRLPGGGRADSRGGRVVWCHHQRQQTPSEETAALSSPEGETAR